MTQQIRTFEMLFDAISEDGVYLCEDIHTSYWPEWGGGVRRRGTYVQYAKGLIDQIHAWHSYTPRLPVTAFTRSAYGLHFYDSVLVIEKRKVEAPKNLKRGKVTIPIFEPDVSLLQKLRIYLGRARRVFDRIVYRFIRRSR